METLADFGVASYLGIDTLSVGIYKAWFGFDDLQSSARLSVVLLIFTLSVILIEKYLNMSILFRIIRKLEKCHCFSHQFQNTNTTTTGV